MKILNIYVDDLKKRVKCVFKARVTRKLQPVVQIRLSKKKHATSEVLCSP